MWVASFNPLRASIEQKVRGRVNLGSALAETSILSCPQALVLLILGPLDPD